MSLTVFVCIYDFLMRYCVLSLPRLTFVFFFFFTVDALSGSEVSAIEGRWRDLVPRALILPVSALTVRILHVFGDCACWYHLLTGCDF